MMKIKIGKKLVGEGEPVFIIAEAGVNHNGQLDIAKKLIDAAKFSGADAIKFQAFKTEQLVTKYAKKAEYQKNSAVNDSQFDLLKSLELTDEEITQLCAYARERDIIFLSSAFDDEHVDLLDKLGVPAFKISSGELTNLPLLAHIAGKNKPVIISTGMGTKEEIKDALDVLSRNGKDEIIVLHCVTTYPTAPEYVQLKKMDALRLMFKRLVGYSDHTLGIAVPIAATALGAVVIEKHFTLDKNQIGPDHKASLEPSELGEMVRSIRDVEKALNSELSMSPQEEAIKQLVRRSIVAKVLIKKGTVITEYMLDLKRPSTGLAPKYLPDIIGKRAIVDIETDELVTLDKLA